MRILFVHLAIALLALSAPAAEPFGYSGMAQIAGDTYLAVSDVKNKPEESRFYTVRVQVLEHRVTDFSINPLEIKGLEELPNDLEAVCAVPGTNLYLASESGYYKGTGGRLYVIRVELSGEVWKAELVKVITHKDLLGNMLDDFPGVGAFGKTDAELRRMGVTTYDGSQIEGLACIAFNNKHYLAVGLRGYTQKGQKSRIAKILWGELNPNTYAIDYLQSSPLVRQSLLGDRDCSDLHITPTEDGKSWSVWSVATRDKNDGPNQGKSGAFNSAVYFAGRLDWPVELNKETKWMRYTPNNTAQGVRAMAGFKIEALAAPHPGIPHSTFAIGTEDEDFGGVWRPLD